MNSYYKYKPLCYTTWHLIQLHPQIQIKVYHKSFLFEVREKDTVWAAQQSSSCHLRLLPVRTRSPHSAPRGTTDTLSLSCHWLWFLADSSTVKGRKLIHVYCSSFTLINSFKKQIYFTELKKKFWKKLTTLRHCQCFQSFLFVNEVLYLFHVILFSISLKLSIHEHILYEKTRGL